MFSRLGSFFSYNRTCNLLIRPDGTIQHRIVGGGDIVWVAWCGPCRAEIPYLKKLEEEMKGSDVVFLGVSLDEKKNHKKWLDVLDKEGLHGVQLFANGWSKIVDDYKIKGIPRFMVFDRAGNVVTIDAPRPSDPALKILLEKTLKKK